MDQDLARTYDEHAVAMYRHGMALLRDEAAVRDVLQDVFMKLAQGRVVAGEMQSERAYLLGMIRYAALDRLRRQKVRREHQTRQREAAGDIFERCSDPDREAFRLQLEKALTTLPPEQREVVMLKLWEERTFDEIASICRIPLNTAASRYRYAIDKLRTLLRPVYEDL